MPKRKTIEPVGERIARLRREQGITQQDLAEKLGVTQPNISEYERGAYVPNATMIVRLAEILGVSADELLGMKPLKPKKSTEGMDTRLSKKLQQIRGLPEHDQRAIMRMINALVAVKDNGRG